MEHAPIVKADDVHVTYRVRQDSRLRLRQVVARGFQKPPAREVYAVRGVSLAFYEGQSVGIIGRNGSGKSTFLSALTGLLPLDSGRIQARSQPTLLGVGAALRPNLSGRANIEIGLLAKGVPRSEIKARFSEIVEFAGLEEFIDLPLTAFSSGMRARLHFSIATIDRPDILLIDEALAVGDQEFKARSLERLAEIRAAAGCVVLVTHSMAEVLQSCDRAVWIDRGKVLADGEPAEVVETYSAAVSGSTA